MDLYSPIKPQANLGESLSSRIDCFHCGLPVSHPNEFVYNIAQQPHSFCCSGCQAVAALIHQGGLDQFYKYRSELNKKPDERVNDYAMFDNNEVQESFVVASEDGTSTADLLLDGITCAACVWLIEKYLLAFDGVKQVSVNVVTHQCTLIWDARLQPLSLLMRALEKIGYRPQAFTQKQQQLQQQNQQRTLLLRLGLAGFGMMQVGMVAIALYAGEFQGIESNLQQLLRWLSLLVATPIVLFSAQPFWMGAWRSLKRRYLTMDVPVSLAIILAYFTSFWGTVTASGEVYFDSIAMFTFFLLLGRYLEMRLRYQNQQLTGMATQLLPISVITVDADANESQIPLVELQIAQRVRIGNGDTIPCDGRVISGRSAVVESLLTGEAKPVSKIVGDEVIAGTINTDGTLIIEATAVGLRTRLSMISQLVQKAEQSKPAVQLLADRVASYFVAVVLLSAATVFIYWWNIEPESALWVTLSVLVVTCPCALSLATPTALTASVAMMRRMGLLVLKSHVIQTLTTINKVIFDKTGTLTHGKPVIIAVKLVQADALTGVEQRSDIPTVVVDDAEILSIAASLEQGSSHPLARAFDNVTHRFTVTHQDTFTGEGVCGDINGDHYRLGKPSFSKLSDLKLGDSIVKHGVVLDTQSNLVQNTKLEDQQVLTQPSMAATDEAGQWLLLTKNGRELAWIGLSDQLRDSAFNAVDQLKVKGIESEILSGDNYESVKLVADELKINFNAAQMPEDKLNYVKHQQKKYQLMMVGDGINDVPVMAGADLSIAMDSATDFARTHADSVLLHNDLTLVPKMIALAEKTKVIIRQNITWAITYNLSALPLAALGYLPPYLAAIGMSVSSLVVLLNALRLYRHSD
ncbi:MAG: Cu2+-exporting ATPase [Pseudohongiellaceae bacterium]|jgi:Cu2+-exporting ATPase